MQTRDVSLSSSSQKTSQRVVDSQAAQKTLNFHTHILDIKSDYRVMFDFSPGMQPTTIVIEPLIKALRSYKLACQTPDVSLVSGNFLPKSLLFLLRNIALS